MHTPILKQQIESLPLLPGVYIFKDDKDKVLYVGKAKRLSLRVRSYFQKNDVSDRIKIMIQKIHHIETIITRSEEDALIVEFDLINKLKPHYNVIFRDDKSFPYICITIQEERPRIFPTRSILKDGNQYIGPFENVKFMKWLLSSIRDAFGLCSCSINERTKGLKEMKPKWHTCFENYLGKCSINEPLEIYNEWIKKIIYLLHGRTKKILQELKEEMEIAAKYTKFEQAVRYREAISAINLYHSKIKTIFQNRIDIDVFAISKNEKLNENCGVILKIREGKLIEKFHRFIIDKTDTSKSKLLLSFIESHYIHQNMNYIPKTIITSEPLDHADAIIHFLEHKIGQKVNMYAPVKGAKRQLIDMALLNAHHYLTERTIEKQKAEREHIPKTLEHLYKALKLKQLPRRIECYDNSHFQSSYYTSSMVVFVDGKPLKSGYMRYKVTDIDNNDDYAAMRQTIRKRYEKLKQTKDTCPNLIVLDGGKGQLNAVLEELKQNNWQHEFDVISIAKRLEEIFVPYQKKSVLLSKTTPALRLLQRIRDEAHRFAITYHRQRRNKYTLKSQITNVSGIGAKRIQKLLTHFGSYKQIQKASLKELQLNIGIKSGEKLYNYFKQNNHLE